MLNNDLLQFLQELKENNNKEWFDVNRKRYQGLRANFLDFVSLLIMELGKIDPSVQYNEAKNCVFRINRDIRFSPDKSPYKTNIGAYIAPGGKNIMRPGYYLHIEPSGCFAAGGMYMPPSTELKAIRTEIFENPGEYLSIIQDKEFKKVFGTVDEEQKLKTAPKDFPKDDPNIELIKLKSYTVSCPVDEKLLFSENAMPQLMKYYRTMVPFIRFLTGALES